MHLRVATIVCCAVAQFAYGVSFVKEVGGQDSKLAGNPIRKVVQMLQSMQAKVVAEGKKQEAMYNKFMCYCASNNKGAQETIAESNVRTASLESSIKEAIAQKDQLEADLVQHQKDYKQAQQAVEAAVSIRQKEAKEFAKEKAGLESDLAALTKSITAVEKGMMGGFLQSAMANKVKQFVMEKAEVEDAVRQELLAFLSGTQADGYVPQSFEIVGILKGLAEGLSKDLATSTNNEAAAVKEHEALVDAKIKEISALTAQKETVMTRIGELGVQIASMKGDLGDTQGTLEADQEYLAEMETDCASKTSEWEKAKKIHSEELVALADTIKVLNDDDALDLFKKTLPAPADESSLVQVHANGALMRKHALDLIRALVSKPGIASSELDLLALALSGNKIGFGKIIKMIDEMVDRIKQEQEDDNVKEEYCVKKLDSADDKSKAIQHSISDIDKVIEEFKGSVAAMAEDIKTLEKGIESLDMSVASATEQRKEENSEYKTLMADNGAAKELLKWAKNRLNKFYNKALYIAPKRELSEEERLMTAATGTAPPTEMPEGIAGTGVSVDFLQLITLHHGASRFVHQPFVSFLSAPKHTKESSSVIAMIDLLVHDLDKEMTQADVAEQDAQSDYEKIMESAKKKRAEDLKALTTKGSSKAAQEEALQAQKEGRRDSNRQLMAALEYARSLHGECDPLLKYLDVRTEARTSEIDALQKAKAVLRGADMSLTQTKAQRFLSK